MENIELESQIAKILIFEPRVSNAFAHIMVEKAEGGETELYMACDLPLLNPEAAAVCKQIALSVASAFKRAYRGTNSSENFENAISQVNQELGKLAETGQTAWVNKFNCVLAARENGFLYISTCGKVACYLLRNEDVSDISCSSQEIHPLKTFENFASGKIYLNDLYVLSTAQIFNYISLERFTTVFTSNDFLESTQQVLNIIKSNAPNHAAFGIILNKQIPQGSLPEEQPEIETVLPAISTSQKIQFKDKLSVFLKELVNLKGSGRLTFAARQGKIKKFFSNFNISQKTASFFSANSYAASRLKTALKNVLANLTLTRFKTFSPAKKFFLLAALLVFVAALTNIFVALWVNKNRAEEKKIIEAIQTAKIFADKAQSAFLYGNQDQSVEFLKQAQNTLPQQTTLKKIHLQPFTEVQNEIQNIKNTLDKVTEITPENIGTLSSSNYLINLPEFLATAVSGRLLVYNKSTGQIQDSNIPVPINTVTAVSTGKDLAVAYTKTGLQTFNIKTGQSYEKFSADVPAENNFVNLRYYPTNSRVYTLDKEKKNISSFTLSSGNISKQFISLPTNEKLTDVLDFAIDGSIYVLTQKSVLRFVAGKEVSINQPFGFAGFSGQGKIYSQTDFKYVYLLDSGNNRIIIFDSKGNLVKTLESQLLNKPEDFAVDEKQKKIYVLTEGSLLRVNIP